MLKTYSKQDFEKQVKKNNDRYNNIYENLNNSILELNNEIDFLNNGFIHENKLNKFLRMFVFCFYHNSNNIDCINSDYSDNQYYYLNLLDFFKNNDKIQKNIKKLMIEEGLNKYIIIYYNSNTNYIFLHNSYSNLKDFNKELKRIDKEFKQIELENS